MSTTDNNIDIADSILLSGTYDPKSKDIIKFIERQMTCLSTDALTQICRIIKKNDEKFTAKKDFVLINLGGLKDETIREIVAFLVFIRKNENVLAHDEKLKMQMKQQIDANNKS
jgi:hypothetical protein